MGFFVIKALSTALLPPLSLLLLAFLGSLLLLFRRRTGWILLVFSLVSLFLLSVPAVATALAGLLERRPIQGSANLGDAQAIVILGGGSYQAAPEYGADTVSGMTLERLRWGARLQRLSGLPIMVCGGKPFSTDSSEAAQMRAALIQDFQASVKWMEERSLNTLENARNARQQLTAEKVDRIALVTHALHMRRARLAFEQAGFRVVEAPTGFSTLHPPGILNYLPSAQGLELSQAVLHEVFGMGWYHLRLAATGNHLGP